MSEPRQHLDIDSDRVRVARAPRYRTRDSDSDRRRRRWPEQLPGVRSTCRAPIDASRRRSILDAWVSAPAANRRAPRR